MFQCVFKHCYHISRSHDIKHSFKTQFRKAQSAFSHRLQLLEKDEGSLQFLPAASFTLSFKSVSLPLWLPTTHSIFLPGPTATTVSWDSGRQTSSCSLSSILVSQDFPLVLLQPAHRSPSGQLTFTHLELAFLNLIQGPPSSYHLPVAAFSAFSSPFLCDPITTTTTTNQQNNSLLGAIWLGPWIGIINQRMGQPSDKDVCKYLH